MPSTPLSAKTFASLHKGESPATAITGLSGAKRDGNPFSPMTTQLSLAGTKVGNPSSGVVQPFYTPPIESPDSVRLLASIWTASGLTLQAPCRLYCGNHWRSGTITATGEAFALIQTKEGQARCSDRRNLLTAEEARQFKNAQARFKRQRQAVLSRLETALEGGKANG